MLRLILAALVLVAASLTTAAPLARTYATWNPADAHPDVVLSADNLTATRVAGADGWAGVRATVSVATGSGAWYWETTYSGTGDAATGLLRGAQQVPLDLQIGMLPFASNGSLYSIGGPDRAGNCYVAGFAAANVGTVPVGGIVRHWLDFDAPFYRVAVNGGDWVTVLSGPTLFYALGVGEYFPAASLALPGSGVAVTANFGASPFTYAVPAGAHAGLYREDPVTCDGFDGTEEVRR